MSTVTPGTCRHCRCTEENACILHTGDTCWWTNDERTVCSNPSCIKAEQARVRALRLPKPRSRFAGWGKGAIWMELRAEQRRRKRRKAA